VLDPLEVFLKRQKIYFSYDKIERWLRSIALPLRALKADSVIGVLRGGYFPAVLVSHITGAPLSFLRYDRVTGTIDASDVKLPPPGARVILCEDIAGSGLTLLNCHDYLLSKGLDVVTVTVIQDKLSRISPDFSINIGDARGILPWERHVGTRQYVEHSGSLINGLGVRSQDHEYEVWGFDLDGVFLRDVPTVMYENDLQAAIEYRAKLPSDLSALRLARPYAIITGRPEEDRAITERWLDEHAIPYTHLYLRDPKKYSDNETSKYKASIADELELTHYVESDPAQALAIADLLPWSQVLRWDIDRSRAISVFVNEVALSRSSGTSDLISAR